MFDNSHWCDQLLMFRDVSAKVTIIIILTVVRPALRTSTKSGWTGNGAYLYCTIEQATRGQGTIRHTSHTNTNAHIVVQRATLEFPVRNSSVNPVKDLRRLALTPRGGSRVSLEPFCRMGTGNLGLGMLVSHSLKSRFTWKGGREWRCSECNTVI